MCRAKTFLASAAVMLALAAPPSVKAQGSWTQVGMLQCILAPSVGFIIAAQQRMDCRYTPNQPLPPEQYMGVMTNIGVDIGAVAGGALAWAVLSPTQGPPAGALAGTYVGVSGEATIGVGGGANVLVGGSARSIAIRRDSRSPTISTGSR